MEQTVEHNVHTAIAFVANNAAVIEQDKVNSFTQNRYSSIAAILRVVKPLMASVGLSVQVLPAPNPEGTTNKQSFIGTVMHAASETKLVQAFELPIPTTKADPQEFGKAITYARRYFMSCVFNLVTEDDDAQGSSNAAKQMLSYSLGKRLENGFKVIYGKDEGVTDDTMEAYLQTKVEEHLSKLNLTSLTQLTETQGAELYQNLRSLADASQ